MTKRLVIETTIVFQLMLGISVTAAETPTFSRDVAPIFYENCVACHRPGEFAPMSLLTYDDARPWARAIRQRVVSREMPPWYAQPGHQEYVNDTSLTSAEIETVVAWVDNGALRGSDADLPPAPQYVKGWTIGQPDVVFPMQAPFDVPAHGTVPYLYFTIPTNLSEDRWIKAVEIVPGDRRVVHHVIASLQRPDLGQPPSPQPALRQDRSRQSGGLGGVTPNKFGVTYPKGVARRIQAGAEIVLQMHYTTIGEAVSDRTSIGLIFQDEPPEMELNAGSVINFQFSIPPGKGDHEVRAERTFNEDTYLFDMMPHMHSRGKDFTYTARYPDGSEEVLLSVPNYNFSWQLTYQLKEPKLLPAGTTLTGVAHFDNSPNNRANPDPKAEVRWGDQTWEEMMIGFFKTVQRSKVQ